MKPTLCIFFKNINGTMINSFWARFIYNHHSCTGSAVAGQYMEQQSGMPISNILNVIIGKKVLTDSKTGIEKNRALLPARQ